VTARRVVVLALAGALATVLALVAARPVLAAPAPAPAPSGSGAARSFTADIPCSACHGTEGWRKRGGSGDAGGFDHATTGFPLTGQHVKTPCVSCHDGKRTVKRACVSCHQDDHRGRLSQACDTCHVPAGWKVTRPLEIHRMTRFPLSGMHVLADCSQCHKRASEHQWTGAPVDCFGCHEREYRRPDLHPLHTGDATSPPFPRDCSQCHRAVGWAPAVFDPRVLTGSVAQALQAAPPNHDVRFPISFGWHRAAGCDDCHTQRATPRLVRCTGCHAHDTARLAAQHKRPVPTEGASCLSCHPAGIRR
jgi:hypothetical protein